METGIDSQSDEFIVRFVESTIRAFNVETPVALQEAFGRYIAAADRVRRVKSAFHSLTQIRDELIEANKIVQDDSDCELLLETFVRFLVYATEGLSREQFPNKNFQDRIYRLAVDALKQLNEYERKCHHLTRNLQISL